MVCVCVCEREGRGVCGCVDVIVFCGGWGCLLVCERCCGCDGEAVEVGGGVGWIGVD